MLELLTLIALACQAHPGGHGVDSGFSHSAATVDAAKTAMRLQVLCQISLARCMQSPQPLGLVVWSGCLAAWNKESGALLPREF